MKKIKIYGVEGYYCVKYNTLLHIHKEWDLDIEVEVACDVEDLTSLKVFQYQDLVKQIKKHYPDYNIEYLKGMFI